MQLVREIAIAVREHDARVQHLAKATHVSFLHRLDTILVSLCRLLVRDFPVSVRCPSHTLDALEHVLLAYQEAGDVYCPISELRYCRTFVVLINREFWKTQQRSDSAPALIPRAGDNLGIAVIEECNAFGIKVEPVANGTACQAELVPKAARQHHPLANAQGFNLVHDRSRGEPESNCFTQLLVREIAPIPVGHDVRDTRLGGCANELALCVAWGCHGHSDDKELLAFEGGNERSLIVVVDMNCFQAGGKLVGTVSAGEGRHGVFASRNEGLGDELADIATSLSKSELGERKGAYADDNDVLNSVGETSRLVLSVLWGHADGGMS